MKKRKKLFLCAAAVTLVSCLAGCGTTGKFIYPADMSKLFRYEGKAVTKDKVVAVVPFEDHRLAENSNMYPMYLIPLMPFGWADYQRPDAANMFLSVASYDATPAEDLAKAAAVSLRQAGLFRDAFFTSGEGKDRADLVISGRIREMRYRSKMFTYCLSVYGPLFWVFGAPAGTSEDRLAADLVMTNKAGETVWTWHMEDERRIVQWIYSKMGHDVKMFAEIYQEGMNRAMKDLAEKMEKDPGSFR